MRVGWLIPLLTLACGMILGGGLASGEVAAGRGRASDVAGASGAAAGGSTGKSGPAAVPTGPQAPPSVGAGRAAASPAAPAGEAVQVTTETLVTPVCFGFSPEKKLFACARYELRHHTNLPDVENVGLALLGPVDEETLWSRVAKSSLHAPRPRPSRLYTLEEINARLTVDGVLPGLTPPTSLDLERWTLLPGSKAKIKVGKRRTADGVELGVEVSCPDGHRATLTEGTFTGNRFWLQRGPDSAVAVLIAMDERYRRQVLGDDPRPVEDLQVEPRALAIELECGASGR